MAFAEDAFAETGLAGVPKEEEWESKRKADPEREWCLPKAPLLPGIFPGGGTGPAGGIVPVAGAPRGASAPGGGVGATEELLLGDEG